MRGSQVPGLFLLLFSAALSEGAGGLYMPTAQTTYSWPLRLGGRIGLNHLEPDDGGYMLYTGTSVSLEAARDGLRFDIGNRYEAFGFLPLYTAGLSASCLYLWDGDDATYLGLEASFSVLLATLYGGVYRRVRGDLHDDLMFTVGIGSGLP